MKILCVLVLAIVAIATAQADDQTDTAFQLYTECSTHNEGLSPCLKKKAIAFMDRLGRMEHLTIFDTIQVNRAPGSALEPALTEEQLDASLPRAIDAKDEILSSMLWDRVGKFVESRSLEISLPKISELIEEGRGKGGGGGGGGGKDKKGGMMKGMMMGIVAKLAALIPIAIAGLFLLAKKALITAKIALLISGIIFIKKLFAAKHHQSHGHGGWQSGGGGGGWQSSGGGWDKRSIDEEAKKLAYNAYAPQ